MYTSADQVVELIASEIRTNGNPELGGMEQEIMTLDSKGNLIPHSDNHQSFIHTAVVEAEKFDDQKAKVKYGDCLLGGKMIIGGEVSYGSYNPETSTLITEFAHAAGTTAWHTLHSSMKAMHATEQAAKKHGFNLFASGMIPNADLDDIRASGAVLPYAAYKFSYENMRDNKNRHISQTTFGNSSFHHNQGFNDPEKFVRYARVALYLQPLATALMANSPIVKGVQAEDDTGRKVKTIRSLRMLSYENYFNVFDLTYAYPDFMLDFKNKFKDVVKGYMDQPLGRTIVNGKKIDVGNLTMSRYAAEGFEHDGNRYFPERGSIEMMFSEPMVDVRLRPFAAPRVEARAHDGAPNMMCAALSAFYRGINSNVAEVENYLSHNISPAEARRQRRDVCYNALSANAELKNGRTISYRQYAEDIINLSVQGLKMRNLGEEKLLEPLQRIAETGRTYADRQIEFVQKAGGKLRAEHMSDMMHEFNYASTLMANGEHYRIPAEPRMHKAEPTRRVAVQLMGV